MDHFTHCIYYHVLLERESELLLDSTVDRYKSFYPTLNAFAHILAYFVLYSIFVSSKFDFVV